jgi:hypothetical protein
MQSAVLVPSRPPEAERFSAHQRPERSAGTLKRRTFPAALAALLLLAPTLPAAAPDTKIQDALSRVSEEAEAFRTLAPRLLAEEKMVQRTSKPPRRFHPRLGPGALNTPKPEYRTRELLSEYGFTTFADSPGALRELRKVVSVDGRPVAAGEQAREKLVRGLVSPNDHAKKRMLEEFSKYGLEDKAAVDFGQVILLFLRHRLDAYSFAYRGTGMVGPEAADILTFEQRGGEGSLLVVGRREAVHLPLTGELWVRHSDSMPLRVVIVSTRKDRGKEVKEEATVDYAMSRFGAVVPVSVVQREYAIAPVDDAQPRPGMGGAGCGGGGCSEMTAENVFQYSSFRLFSVEAEVKFTGIEVPKPQPTPTAVR